MAQRRADTESDRYYAVPRCAVVLPDGAVLVLSGGGSAMRLSPDGAEWTALAPYPGSYEHELAMRAEQEEAARTRKLQLNAEIAAREAEAQEARALLGRYAAALRLRNERAFAAFASAKDLLNAAAAPSMEGMTPHKKGCLRGIITTNLRETKSTGYTTRALREALNDLATRCERAADLIAEKVTDAGALRMGARKIAQQLRTVEVSDFPDQPDEQEVARLQMLANAPRLRSWNVV